MFNSPVRGLSLIRDSPYSQGDSSNSEMVNYYSLKKSCLLVGPYFQFVGVAIMFFEAFLLHLATSNWVTILFGTTPVGLKSGLLVYSYTHRGIFCRQN